jgi:hypothetical protein
MWEMRRIAWNYLRHAVEVGQTAVVMSGIAADISLFRNSDRQ